MGVIRPTLQMRKSRLRGTVQQASISSMGSPVASNCDPCLAWVPRWDSNLRRLHRVNAGVPPSPENSLSVKLLCATQHFCHPRAPTLHRTSIPKSQHLAFTRPPGRDASDQPGPGHCSHRAPRQGEPRTFHDQMCWLTCFLVFLCVGTPPPPCAHRGWLCSVPALTVLSPYCFRGMGRGFCVATIPSF